MVFDVYLMLFLLPYHAGSRREGFGDMRYKLNKSRMQWKPVSDIIGIVPFNHVCDSDCKVSGGKMSHNPVNMHYGLISFLHD